MAPIDDAPTGRATRRCAPTMAFALALTVVGTPHVVSAAEAMRVVRDPITGELRAPTAAEVAAFEKAESQERDRQRASNAPVAIHHPDGTVEIRLGEDTMMNAGVKANEDASLTADCRPARKTRSFVANPARTSTAKSASKKGAEQL